MPLSPYTNFDWITEVITIPQSYMTLVGGVVYDLDMDVLRQDIGAVMAGEVGIVFDDAHAHSGEDTISGIVFARKVVFQSPYTITVTPDGGWIVSCSGANHNTQDVYNNLTGPTLLPNLSAGLVVTATSGLTAGESTTLTQAAADAELARQARTNREELSEDGTTYRVYDDADTSVIPELDQVITDKDGNPIDVPSGTPARRSKGTGV